MSPKLIDLFVSEVNDDFSEVDDSFWFLFVRVFFLLEINNKRKNDDDQPSDHTRNELGGNVTGEIAIP